MSHLPEVLKIKRSIKNYAFLTVFSALCFFIAFYLFDIYYSALGISFVTLVFVGPTTKVVAVCSGVGFLVFVILLILKARELYRVSPREISGEDTSKLKSKNNWLILFLFFLFLLMVIVTILNDPSILSEDNLK